MAVIGRTCFGLSYLSCRSTLGSREGPSCLTPPYDEARVVEGEAGVGKKYIAVVCVCMCVLLLVVQFFDLWFLCVRCQVLYVSDLEFFRVFVCSILKSCLYVFSL